MKVAVLCPSAATPTHEGVDRLWSGTVDAIERLTSHRAEMVVVESPESTIVEVVHSYVRFADLGLDHFDLVITGTRPAWMVRHPRHVVYISHLSRRWYEEYHGESTIAADDLSPEGRRVLALIERLEPGRPGARDRLLEAALTLVEHAQPGAVEPGFPRRLTQRLVHWLDRDALHPSRIHRYLATSDSVAQREVCLPAGVDVEVVVPPSNVLGLTGSPPGHGFLTVNSLDPSQRIGLAIAAVRQIGDPTVRLRIAGSGAQDGDLRERAHGDDRIQFLGEISDAELVAEYARCRAVVVVPRDEDRTVTTYESHASGRPVITCTDSGGPAEMVTNEVNGLVVEPEPRSLAAGLTRLHTDLELARRLGEAGLQHVPAITWTRVVGAVLGGGRPTMVSLPARRPRVLALSTYPATPAEMGGQIRINRLLTALSEHAEVKLLCLAEHPEHQISSSGFRQHSFPPDQRLVDQDWAWRTHVEAPTGDIAAALVRDGLGSLAPAARLAAARADVVVLCHPYLGPLLPSRARVVYDAHNVESVLKASMYRPGPVATALANAVREVESSVLRAACLVTAVSPADAIALSAQTSTTARFEVVPNGFDPFPPDSHEPKRRVERRDQYLQMWARAGGSPACARLALFVGSAHPPNIEAARRIIESAWALPEVLFVLVGTHGPHLTLDRVPPNVAIRGVTPADVLRRLLSCCDVALNPITGGSGTNLKMLEYIAAGAPVVATEVGARGLGLSPGLHYALAEPTRLADALRRDLAHPERATARAIRAREATNLLRWSTVAKAWVRLVLEVAG